MTIIFDLDGTLLDTVDDLAASVNHALTSIGLPTRSRSEVRTFLGNGIRTLVMKSLADQVGEEEAERAFGIFRAYYLEHCLDRTQPYEGIMPLLDSLREQGHRLAIVSNKLDPAVKSLNQRFFPRHIEVAIGEGAPLASVEGGVVRRKPNPDALLAVMQELGATPADTLYVGDSEVDIETSRNAGVPCVSVAWGFRDEPDLVAAGATTIIHNPSELLDIISAGRA